MFRIFEKEVKGELKGWSIETCTYTGIDVEKAEKAGLDDARYHSASNPKFADYLKDEYIVTITNYSKGESTRSSDKSFSSKEEMEAFVEEKVAAKVKAKFPESTPGFPIMLQQKLEQFKQSGRDQYQLYSDCGSYEGFDLAIEYLNGIDVLQKLEICCGDDLGDALSRIDSIEDVTVKLPYNSEKFASDFSKMRNVKRFTFSANSVKHLDESITKLDVEELTIDAQRLETVSDTFENLENLKTLKLECGYLKDVPESIAKMKNLESLTLQYCNSDFPNVIFGMKTLKELRLTDFRMYDFPSDILTMDSLEILQLPGYIESLPEELFLMPNLREFYFDGYGDMETTLPEFPADSKLRVLKVDKAGITRVPASLFQLPLKKLNLQHNKIETLPDTFMENDTIEIIRLEYNPLGVDWDVCHKGMAAVKEWYELEKKKKSGEISDKVIDLSFDGDSVPDEKERKKIVASTIDRYKTFKALSYGISDKLLEKVQAFIIGETHELTITGGTPAKFVYKFDDLKYALAPVKEWSFADERILSIFTSPQVWQFEEKTSTGRVFKKGFFDQFTGWLRKEVETETDFDTFKTAVDFLSEKLKMDRDEFIPLAVIEMGYGMLTDLKEPNSLGRYIVDYVNEETLFSIWDEAKDKYWSGDFIQLILGAKPELHLLIKDTVLPESLKESDGKVCAPFRNLNALCPLFPNEYKEYLKMTLKETTCMDCLSEVVLIAMDRYPEEEELILSAIERVLVTLSEKLNGDRSKRLRFRDRGYHDKGGEQDFIEEILKRYGSKVFGFIETFTVNTKSIKLENISSAYKYLGDEAFPLVKEAVNKGGHYGELFAIAAEYNIDLSFALDTFLRAFDTKSLEIAQVIGKQLAIIMSSEDLLDKAKEYFKKKKKDDRLRGVYLLENGDETHREYLHSIMEEEKNAEVREKIFSLFSEEQKSISKETILERTAFAKEAGFIKKDVKKWLSVDDLPALFWSDGGEVEKDVIHYLLYRQFRLGQLEKDVELYAIYDLIDTEKSGEFARALLDLALNNGGASAGNRFALIISALLGGDSQIESLQDLIYKKQNLNATTMLGIIATDAALLELRKVTKFYNTKYPNVREAAEEAILNASDLRGVPVGELFERIAPDFGFADGFLELNSAEGAKAFITPELKFAYVGSNGKVRKSAPKEVSKEEKKELTALNKEIKAVAKEYAADYESAMVDQRRWNIPALMERFESNAMLNALGQGIVWGVYLNGELEDSFIFDSEGSLIDRMGEPIDESLAEKGELGIVHPLDLESEDLEEWIEYWEDEKLPKQPFLQLERSVFRFEDFAEPGNTYLNNFADKVLAPGTFKGRATKRLWRRGAPGDGGALYLFYREFKSAGISTVLMLDGMAVSLDWSEEVTLGDLYFLKQDDVKINSYMFHEPRSGKDERLVNMGNIPRLIFSEVLSDMMFITK